MSGQYTTHIVSVIVTEVVYCFSSVVDYPTEAKFCGIFACQSVPYTTEKSGKTEACYFGAS